MELWNYQSIWMLTTLPLFNLKLTFLDYTMTALVSSAPTYSQFYSCILASSIKESDAVLIASWRPHNPDITFVVLVQTIRVAVCVCHGAAHENQCIYCHGADHESGCVCCHGADHHACTPWQQTQPHRDKKTHSLLWSAPWQHTYSVSWWAMQWAQHRLQRLSPR